MISRLRHGLTVASLALFLGVGLIVVGPTVHPVPVRASASDCGGGANGFVDISDSLQGNEVRGFNPGTGYQRLSLEAINLGGDQVWMDWTRDGGRTWLQCGPFTARTGQPSITSAAKATSSDPNYQFRACAGSLFAVPGIYCTSWW